MRRLLVLGLGLWGAMAVAGGASAQIAIPVSEVPEGRVRIDGSLRDWRNVRMLSVGSGQDAAMRFAIGYDAAGLIIAADVADDRLVRSSDPGTEEDAVIVTLATPEGRGLQATEVWIYAGVSGRSAAVAKAGPPGRRPSSVRDAEVVEGPRSGGRGYLVEARVPWSAIAGASRWMEGRIAVRYRDVDMEARPRVEDEPATAAVDPNALDRLPAIQTTGGEQNLLRTFLASRELEAATPRFDLRGNVAGDRRPERVVLVDRFLVVFGAGYRNGETYAFLELPGVRNAQDVREARLQDLTADGLAELTLLLRQTNELGSRDLWQVVTFGGESPALGFAVETRKEISAGSVEATLRVRPGRGRNAATIEVRAGEARGLDARSLRERPAPGVEAILVPWGQFRARTYRWDGTRFATLEEEANPDYVAPEVQQQRDQAQRQREEQQAAEPSLPGVDQILAAFRRERGIGANVQPRFRHRANVAEDRRPEEVMVFGHALLVLGPGYRNGTGYFYFELPVAGDADVLQVRAQDVTGDGTAEILLKVRQHVGDVTREILMVHQLQARGFPRLLAVEVARERGRDRIQNEIRFVGTGRTSALEIRPGTARGWTADNYPFTRSEEPGISPLLLPWADTAVRFGSDGRGGLRRSQ